MLKQIVKPRNDFSMPVLVSKGDIISIPYPKDAKVISPAFRFKVTSIVDGNFKCMRVGLPTHRVFNIPVGERVIVHS